jgi:UDP-glucose 4-epimerase
MRSGRNIGLVHWPAEVASRGLLEFSSRDHPFNIVLTKWRVQKQLQSETVLVTGAAGFIASHLSDRLLREGHSIIGIDNLSRGTRRNLHAALKDPAFRFFEVEMTDIANLQRIASISRIDTVWHMVANSDISAGIADPDIDLNNTFFSTYNLLKVMRETDMKKLVFASTSAVYGVHEGALREDTGPLFPISNYGAMKLASEAIISAAVESFLEAAWIFRFPNVVGSRATHGIIFDLLTKLRSRPESLEVLGDGTQQKPYLHVSELIDAMLFVHRSAHKTLNCFNIGPADEGTTVHDIAREIVRAAAPGTPIHFTGGSRGWVGDVPKFYYSIDKIKSLGWSPQLGSFDAIARAVAEVHAELFTVV